MTAKSIIATLNDVNQTLQVSNKIQGLPTIKARCGCQIKDYIAELCQLAKQEGQVQGKFNDIKFIINKADTIEQALKNWDTLRQIAVDKYQQSPEYKASFKQSLIDLANKKEKLKKLMVEFETLDWQSFEKILSWLYSISYIADDMNITVDIDTILGSFKVNHFHANANLNKDFRPDDKDNVARYIIGQAIDGFEKMGCPHSVILSHIKAWQEKAWDTGIVVKDLI